MKEKGLIGPFVILYDLSDLKAKIVGDEQGEVNVFTNEIIDSLPASAYS